MPRGGALLKKKKEDEIGGGGGKKKRKKAELSGHTMVGTSSKKLGKEVRRIKAETWCSDALNSSKEKEANY